MLNELLERRLTQVQNQGTPTVVQFGTPKIGDGAPTDKDALGALRKFGQEIGQCGHCRKQLTDEESRKFGIGPVCKKKLGI